MTKEIANQPRLQPNLLLYAARFANFERILCFSVLSIISADLLENTNLLEQVEMVMV